MYRGWGRFERQTLLASGATGAPGTPVLLLPVIRYDGALALKSLMPLPIAPSNGTICRAVQLDIIPCGN
jgi:hypothetical protein